MKDEEKDIVGGSFDETEKEFIIKIPKKQNYSLDDLEKKLISYLYNLRSYEINDILLIYILYIKRKELDSGSI